MAAFEELEKLVLRIQKQLAPEASVEHNVKLPGRHTGVQRQIDVLVRQKIGQYEIRIVIDCKDYSRPVDVKGVEEFHGLLDDVGAQKGVLVCPAGFSQAAKNRAESWLIDLCRPIDTGDHKWKANPAIAGICDFREAMMSFGLSCSAPYPFQTTIDFYENLSAYDEKGNELGIPLNTAMHKWNEGLYPIDVGTHEGLAVFETCDVLADNGYGMRVPLQLTVNLHVSQQLFFGHFPITNISGFTNEVAGGVITNAFTMGILDPDTIANSWQPLENEQDAPMQPGVVLRGLLGWVT